MIDTFAFVVSILFISVLVGFGFEAGRTWFNYVLGYISTKL